MKVNILGINVDRVNIGEAVGQVEHWLALQGQALQARYIVTPNVEFVMAAQSDPEFKKILNQADLAIPDSAHFGWAINQLQERNWFFKIIKWPLFLFGPLTNFKTVTGTDLMGQLIKVAAEQGLTVGFLGGRDRVAEKLVERLKKKYPKLKVTFASSGGEIDNNGVMVSRGDSERGAPLSARSGLVSPVRTSNGAASWQDPKIPTTDILFVAFGQVKQEKWIAQNLVKQPVKVMMGVGGSFDYLSGLVPRAPIFVRAIGFEWLFRLIIQPWRVKRFYALVKFIFLVLLSK